MGRRGNIEFFPNGENIIRYNAIRKFRNNIIKIPSYVVNEVFKHKMTIDIYYNGIYQTSYSYDNLFSYIKGFEAKLYEGVFRQKDITYNLTRIEV